MAAVLKTARGFAAPRGFESHTLRTTPSAPHLPLQSGPARGSGARSTARGGGAVDGSQSAQHRCRPRYLVHPVEACPPEERGNREERLGNAHLLLKEVEGGWHCVADRQTETA